ncbi:hypothetical protein G5714_004690 [Onychostoma macrolepis]|uniref:Uncharacterized protein n=1 Tax=Onychostoma macrolepis TaxID=369639 RepID=A0A7J6D5F4_9TELE|nr:hypothetical protein G5714_004690 [Onychostoma macrolepis]
MAAIVEMDDLSGQDLYQKRPRPVGESQRSLHVISEEPHTPNTAVYKGTCLGCRDSFRNNDFSTLLQH